MLGGIPTQATQNNQPVGWRQFEAKFKHGLVVGGAALILLLTFSVGPQFLYMLFGSLGIASLILFPDDIEALVNYHKPALIGAAVGFVYSGGNLFGALLLGWAGHEINKMTRSGLQRANDIAERAQPYLHPYDYAKRRIGETWQRFTNFLDYMAEEVPVNGEPPIERYNTEPELQADTVREDVLLAPPTPPLLFQANAVNIAPANDTNVPQEPAAAHEEPAPRRTQSRWASILPKGPITLI